MTAIAFPGRHVSGSLNVRACAAPSSASGDAASTGSGLGARFFARGILTSDRDSVRWRNAADSFRHGLKVVEYRCRPYKADRSDRKMQ